MNVFQNSDTFEKCLRFSFHAIGNVVTVGVAVFLILAWILMSPLLRFGTYLGDLYRTRLNPKMKRWL
jgi:hypothetical protein